MTDLAERFARTQDWIYLPSSQTWRAPDGPYRNVAIDERILPLIWADCKAKGWTIHLVHEPVWTKCQIYDAAWKALHPRVDNPDPIAALCEAYCKARDKKKPPE